MTIKCKAGYLYLIIAMCIATSCKKPEGLKYLGVENFKLHSINLEQSVVSADLIYYNPNNFRMKLKSAEMDVTVNDNFLGHSTLDTLMTIPKKDTFLIPVHLQVKMKALITNSLDALLSNEFDVSLKGTARIGKGGIFFNFPFTYRGKQTIKIF